VVAFEWGSSLGGQPCRQLFCNPSTKYLRNSCASSCLPCLKCFAMARREGNIRSRERELSGLQKRVQHVKTYPTDRHSSHTRHLSFYIFELSFYIRNYHFIFRNYLVMWKPVCCLGLMCITQISFYIYPAILDGLIPVT